MTNYTYFMHKHNFAVWAGARAAQRRFTTVSMLRDAIEQSGVREFLKTGARRRVSQDTFDKTHAKWCRSIKSYLSRRGVKGASFGRAAKLIAVYLKVMVIIASEAKSSLSNVAHPPIDRITLQNLARAKEVQSPYKREWRRLNWTQLDEADYYKLINQLRACLRKGEPMWHLEKYWSVTND